MPERPLPPPPADRPDRRPCWRRSDARYHRKHSAAEGGGAMSVMPATVTSEGAAKPAGSAHRALAALRPQRRSQRQGQGPARPRHCRLRRHLRHHRAAAGDVRRGQPRAMAADAAAAQDAIATSRPDILDRNGAIIATDVNTPSLFAEPRQHDRRRRGGRIADRGAARSRRHRSARASVVQARLRLAQARNHAEAAAGDSPAGPSGRRLSDREQARLSERHRRSRT